MPDDDSSNTPPSESQNQAQAVTPSTPDQGTSGAGRNANSDDRQNQTGELAREFRIAEKWQIGTNIGLGVIGLFALIIYYGQLSEMRMATRVTKTAADAAKSAAETAKDTFRLTNRPRLKILGITQNQAMVNGKLVTYLDSGRLTVRIDVPNTGSFPARNVRFFRYDNVSKRDQVAQRPYEELNGEPKLIPPKADGGWNSGMTISGQGVLTESELAGLKNGALWATFSILITYDDDFGEKTHHAEYCGLFTLHPDNDICPWPVRND